MNTNPQSQKPPKGKQQASAANKRKEVVDLGAYQNTAITKPRASSNKGSVPPIPQQRKKFKEDYQGVLGVTRTSNKLGRELLSLNNAPANGVASKASLKSGKRGHSGGADVALTERDENLEPLAEHHSVAGSKPHQLV